MLMQKTILDTDIFSEILKQKHSKVVNKAKHYYDCFGYYTTSTIIVEREIIGTYNDLDLEIVVNKSDSKIFMETDNSDNSGMSSNQVINSNN